MSSLNGFRIAANTIRYIGHDLRRPECVLACPNGDFLVPDLRGTVMRIRPDGCQVLLGDSGGQPNGLAIDADGNIVVANIRHGRVSLLSQDGAESVLFDHFEDKPLGAANFVFTDRDGILWLTVSTRLPSVTEAIEGKVADGCIFQVRDGKLLLMADGLYFANELRIDERGEWLYVAETTAGRISRAPILADGSLGIFRPFGPSPVYEGAYVDGIAFDQEGNLWITELSRNALLVLTPKECLFPIFEDPEGKTLSKPTSIAFAGPDLRTVIVGSLKMQQLATFRSPVPGQPMHHWT